MPEKPEKYLHTPVASVKWRQRSEMKFRPAFLRPAGLRYSCRKVSYFLCVFVRIYSSLCSWLSGLFCISVYCIRRCRCVYHRCVPYQTSASFPRNEGDSICGALIAGNPVFDRVRYIRSFRAAWRVTRSQRTGQPVLSLGHGRMAWPWIDPHRPSVYSVSHSWCTPTDHNIT